MLITSKFQIRNAQLSDVPALIELEKEWSPELRASAEDLKLRIEKFASGFFIAEDHTGMIASIIAHPYQYLPDDLSRYKTWADIVENCYQKNLNFETNSLYIISGTTKKTPYVTELFNAGIDLIMELAQKLKKRYVTAGALLPGFARFKKTFPQANVVEYVFKQSQGRFIDPLIEKYRRLEFYVPDEKHIFENYFPDKNSLGHSALVVRDLWNN